MQVLHTILVFSFIVKTLDKHSLFLKNFHILYKKRFRTPTLILLLHHVVLLHTVCCFMTNVIWKDSLPSFFRQNATASCHFLLCFSPFFPTCGVSPKMQILQIPKPIYRKSRSFAENFLPISSHKSLKKSHTSHKKEFLLPQKR